MRYCSCFLFCPCGACGGVDGDGGRRRSSSLGGIRYLEAVDVGRKGKAVVVVEDIGWEGRESWVGMGAAE